jgi:hypothetical protein
MIVTEQFVFAHLHKCGGSFVSEALLRFDPSARRIGYHYPLDEVPDEYRALPVVSSIRDPFEYYVSYYAFQMKLIAMGHKEGDADPRNGIDVVFEEASDHGRSDFHATCRRLASIGQDEALFGRILARLPDRFDLREQNAPPEHRTRFRGMNVRKSDFEQVRGTGHGLMTFLLHHLIGTRDVHFLRLEQLRRDLLQWFDGIGWPCPDEMRAFILDAKPVNTSSHQSAQTYYDGDTRRCVLEGDADIFDRFGYETA